MSPDRLLAHFDRISEAPDAVPRLRRFILDLAVRGKLVEQDPGEEPAADLLKQIRAERESVVKKGLIEKPEPLLRGVSNEAPFILPAGWIFVQLQNICISVTDGDHLPPPKAKDGVPFLVIGNVRTRSLDFSGCRFVSMEYYDSLDPIRKPTTGDILYTLVGSYGITVPVSGDRPFCVQRHIGILRPSRYLQTRFLARALESHFVLDQATNCATGIAQKTVPLSGLRRILIPFPPLAEQHRIVAKIDELMALCDRMEAAQADRESLRDRLAAVSLHRLNNGADAESFREHARFHLRHLPRLTTRPGHIRRLKETILELAVTGKLSEQRSDDGDAQNLLSRLGTKHRKVRNGSVDGGAKSPERLPPLPASWAWAIIDQVAAADDNAITDGPFGANLKTAHYVNTPGYRVIRLQNIGRGHFRTEHRSYIDKGRFERLAKHRIFAGDLVVAGLVDPLVRCCEVPHDIGPAVVKADCYRFKVHPNFSSRFALYYLNSPLCQRLAAVHHHGMTLVRIGLGNFRLIPIPVPPIAEQQRIVAKVEELLTLCDRLDAQLVVSQTISRHRIEAVLYETLAACSISSTQRSHEAQAQFEMGRQKPV